MRPGPELKQRPWILAVDHDAGTRGVARTYLCDVADVEVALVLADRAGDGARLFTATRSLCGVSGAGVYYGSALSEARALTGEHACVVGGGNSAGQAALHLAEFAKSLTIVVRSKTLAASMSDYLVKSIERAPNIDIRSRPRSTVAAGKGASNGSTSRTAQPRRSNASQQQRCSSSSAPTRAPTGSHPTCNVTPGATSRPVDTATAASTSPARFRRSYSKRQCPVCSPSATCGRARSSASPPPPAKERSASDSSTTTSTNDLAERDPDRPPVSGEVTPQPALNWCDGGGRARRRSGDLPLFRRTLCRLSYSTLLTETGGLDVSGPDGT